MDDELKAALDAVPETLKGTVTWGDRGGGRMWGASVGGVREFGHPSAAAAVRAALARLTKEVLHTGPAVMFLPCGGRAPTNGTTTIKIER